MLNCKSVPRPPFLLKNCYFGVLDYVFNNILTFLTENPLLKTDFKIAEITNGANDTVPDICADYGKMDKQGRINEAIGIVVFNTDDYFYYESNSN